MLRSAIWPKFWSIAATAAAGLSAGCGGDRVTLEPGAGSFVDDGTPMTYEPCTAEQRVGSFTIDLADRYTSVGGQVYDGVAPRDVPVEVSAQGACQLFAAPQSLCNPACDTTREVCGADNQCRPSPVAHSLGKVTVQGLLVPLEMDANLVTKAYTNPASARLPHPGFDPGANLRLSTSGGDYAPIQLRGWGVSLLVGVMNPIPVRLGEAVVLSWQPPEDPGPARVHLNLNINHHGSTSNWIECDVEDDGGAEIPVELIDALLARGQSGYPTLTVTRRSVSSVQIEPGCVELAVRSELTSDVLLDGLTSCSRPSDCAAGQACGPEFYCL